MPDTILFISYFGKTKISSVVFGFPVHGMFWRVETVNKAMIVIESNPL